MAVCISAAHRVCRSVRPIWFGPHPGYSRYSCPAESEYLLKHRLHPESACRRWVRFPLFPESRPLQRFLQCSQQALQYHWAFLFPVLAFRSALAGTSGSARYQLVDGIGEIQTKPFPEMDQRGRIERRLLRIIPLHAAKVLKMRGLLYHLHDFPIRNIVV